MMSADTLLKKMPSCRNKTILVVGDVMLDEYHWCKVARISPEAPVPVCRVINTTLVPGGAANVAQNLKSLGATPLLFGVLGNDSSGDKFITELTYNDLNTDFLIRSKQKPTILKSRIVAHQQHVVRVDREDDSPISRQYQYELLRNLETVIEKADALVISDYLKGTLPPRFTQRVIQLAREKDLMIIVDPKGDHYLKYKGATLLTPNFSEFQTVAKKRIEREYEVEKEARKLINRFSLQAMLVTRSEKGMSLIPGKGQQVDIPTRAKEVYDITGAGDTVVAGLTLALASGWPMDEAAYFANYAAGIVVGKIGTSTTSLEEIEHSLKHDEHD